MDMKALQGMIDGIKANENEEELQNELLQEQNRLAAKEEEKKAEEPGPVPMQKGHSVVYPAPSHTVK